MRTVAHIFHQKGLAFHMDGPLLDLMSSLYIQTTQRLLWFREKPATKRTSVDMKSGSGFVEASSTFNADNVDMLAANCNQYESQVGDKTLWTSISYNARRSA